MALKQCLECGGEVEDQEKICPHCGTKQRQASSKLLVLAILAGAGFVAWQFLFPNLTRPTLTAGSPAVTTEASPACMTADLLETYLRFQAQHDEAGTDNLLRSGCNITGPDMPLTILKILPSGMAMVQGFYQGHGANFWMSLSDLRPYKAK